VTELGQREAETGSSSTVDLTIPADPSMVSVLRTVTATLASRRDFTIEEIDDLRIAVDEACALVLPHVAADARLAASFSGTGESIVIEVKVRPVIDSQGIDQSGFAWLVLSALADEVSTRHSDDELSVSLTKTRSPRA
jgi:serine/threonine-protein kinase RsbW